MEIALGYIVLFLVGFIAAIIGSIVGLGGGIIIVPTLLLLSPTLFGHSVSSATAVGTSLFVLIFTALASTVNFIRQRRVDFRSGLLFFVTSGPAAMLGAYLTGGLQEGLFQILFGLFMLMMAILLMVRDRIRPLRIRWKINRTYTDASGVATEYGYSVVPALAVGFAVGLVSGLFGIGGGSLFVPLMVLLFRFPPHVATATSMLVILLSSATGSITHFLEGNIDGGFAAALAPGAVIGGWVGAGIAGRMSGKHLLLALRITLLIFSLYLIWRGILAK